MGSSERIKQLTFIGDREGDPPAAAAAAAGAGAGAGAATWLDSQPAAGTLGGRRQVGRRKEGRQALAGIGR